MPAPPAAIEVGDEGRPADGPEDEVRAAERRGRARGLRAWSRELEGARATSASTCAGSSRTRRVERSTHGAGRRERVEGPVAQDLHPDLGQDPERGAVDRLDLVGGQDLDRPERVDQPPPRQLRDPGRGATRWRRRGSLGADPPDASGLLRSVSEPSRAMGVSDAVPVDGS